MPQSVRVFASKRKILLVSVGLAFFASFLFVGPSVVPAEEVKITICHFPPGSPGDFHTIHIGSQKAADKHLVNHPGDFLGECCRMIDQVCGPPENDCKAWDCAADTCVSVDVQCSSVPCMDLTGCDPAGGCEYADRVCPTGRACYSLTDQCELTCATVTLTAPCPCWDGSEGSAGTSLADAWSTHRPVDCEVNNLCIMAEFGYSDWGAALCCPTQDPPECAEYFNTTASVTWLDPKSASCNAIRRLYPLPYLSVGFSFDLEDPLQAAQACACVADIRELTGVGHNRDCGL